MDLTGTGFHDRRTNHKAVANSLSSTGRRGNMPTGSTIFRCDAVLTFYSSRSERIGSSRAARMAGNTEAAAATSKTIAATPA